MACKGFKNKNHSDSCDEYPFASTGQGAFFKGRARTARGHVPVGQNKQAGAVLGAFYRGNRMLNKDAFYVQVQQ